MKKYQIIYADPPWSYNDKKGGDKKYASAEGHYSSMTAEQIYNLQFAIDDIADENSTLFIWVTFPLLAEGLETISRWGFKYKTVGFVWVKTRNGYPDHRGIGHWTMCNAELCLIGTKGTPKRTANNIEQVILASRGKHSQKPAEARKRITDLMGDLPRIELFARKPNLLFDADCYEGWDVWDNEVESDIELIEESQ